MDMEKESLRVELADRVAELVVITVLAVLLFAYWFGQ